ncbi:AI-2E family transporter [Thermosediminibacter litoriperuensis]|uniref:Putative PurR-regulated permease PerM n=1 Tax=Thermosediminibacter litoriperuensis TaxID=291989 RepID=A0A5S5AYV5_9FIRM|nr:AI-2E family transporter [Thermosediminibacter litoriperuensis]TYP59894.1 putative PurR-regulated permease PerM [Thermosediminibacter litoriperuensis]
MRAKIFSDRIFLYRLFLFIVFILLVMLIYRVRDKLYNVVLPCGVGILIAYILNPIVLFLTVKGFKRHVAVALIYFILLCSLAVAMIYIVPVVIAELNKLIETVPFYAREFQNFVYRFRKNYRNSLPVGIQEVIDRNIDQMESLLLDLLQNLVGILLSWFSGLFSFILGPVLGFYILKDLDKLKNSMTRYIPNAYRDRVFHWVGKVDSTLGRYVRGQLTVSLIVGILTSLALYILGIDFALLIGILAGITNIIPYFGPIIGAIPAIAIALLKYPRKVPWVVIAFALIQQVESGIISPHIMGESLGLHPITVILSLLIGGTFFGVWGLILAVPVAALLKVVMVSALEKFESR